MVASVSEKEALFSTAGSLWMLIACAVATVSLLTTLISNILSLNIGGLLLFILDILMVVGLWVTFANGKKRKLAPSGISLIKVPYIIQFIFSIISFIGNLIIWIITLNVISLLVGIVSFVFACICFSSVKKTLDIAGDINQNKSVMGRKAGKFAAIVKIISATFTLIGDIVSYIFISAIKEMLGDSILATLLGAGGTMTIVVAAVSFIASISVAIVLLQFGKKIKEING